VKTEASALFREKRLTINSQQRRVRKLRLTAPAESFFRRGEILLEDALRIASLPADKGRVLLIRSLNVGKIRSNLSSATLSLAIEQALYMQSAQAVHAEEPTAYEQSAVYFRDDAEPYISLAVKLAREENTDAWFWPLAVRAWKPEMSRDEALRALLMAILRTEAGTRAAIAMIQELHSQRVSDRLLSALHRQDGTALLRAFGWSMPSHLQFPYTNSSSPDDEHEEHASLCPAQWSGVVMRWINRWGMDDPRSIWLSAVVLVTEKPARLLDHSLIERARQSVCSERWPLEARVFQPSILEDDERASAHDLSSRNQLEIAREPTEKTSGQMEIKVPEVTPQERSSELISSAQRSSREQLSRDNEKRFSGDESTSSKTHDDATAHSTLKRDESIEEQSSEIREEARDEPENLPVSGWATCPQPTRYAGLLFLIPLMSRLGISSILETNPSLIEIDLPQRLFHFVAERLSIPEFDPALLFLSTELPERLSVNCEYSIPQSWMHGLCDKGLWTIRRMTKGRGARILYDGSGRLALGLWRGRMPQAARALINGQTLKRGRVMPFETDLSILCQTWLTALRRWCRRYARIGLQALVCRTGRVSVTPTHIDIFFDHQQADLRIRKVGLDINPGWVAWLGRVVTYHYLYGEQIYGK